ncbi:MAG: hypothetical protein R2794_11905 [Chitinophagales bacterium]
MKKTGIFLLCALLLFSCNNKKYAKITDYNDHVVKYLEQAELTVKTWSNTNFMQLYELKKQNSILKLLDMQDSLTALTPLHDDDTLRQAAMGMIDNYLKSFTIYDSVYAILTDTAYYKSDSIRVRELLKSNQNMLQQQADAFQALQKRFSERYGVEFLE